MVPRLRAAGKSGNHGLPALPPAGLALLGLLCAASLLGWPLDVLVVRGGGEILFYQLTAPGGGFATRYIHSVERSPVEDYYRVLNGRIWSWREKVRTHNAGLPYGAPERGRFYHDPPWMVVEGGRWSWDQLFVRIGDETFGRNEFQAPTGAWAPLYRMLPGKRLAFRVERKPLLQTFFLPGVRLL
jgi:hypothetical protein